MQVTIWHNPNCSKSRDALAAIRAAGITPQVVEYLKTPPSEAELRAALRRMGIARPHIAVAALNPHAGEGGLFGTQDTDVTAPVVAQCNAEGMHVSGPIPGDTVFVKLRGGQYDAVVAMYHDQGHIPVKLLGFQMNPATGTFDSLSGVNITLGLPVIRTSVDHGTAFDIAGKGVANPASMKAAIKLAAELARPSS